MVKEKIKKSKWDIDEAEAVYWLGPEAAISLTKGMRKIYGFGFNRNIVFWDESGVFKWCLLKKELVEIGKKCFEKFKNKKFRKRVEEGFKKIQKRLDKKIVEYKSENLGQMSVDDLFGHLKFFTDCYKEMFSYGLFIEPFDYIFFDVFQKAFSKYKLSPNEVSGLTAIPGISYLNIETQDLLKIAIKKQKGEDISKELEDHSDRYEWIATGHAGKKKIGINYFRNRIQEFEKQYKNLSKELKHLEDFRDEVIKKKLKIVKKYNQKDFPEALLRGT